VSRAKVAERFGLDPAGITVVREAADPVFAPRPPAEVERQLAGLGLSRAGYVVYVGGISPRKNVEVLLDAYARLSQDGDVPPLVLVGALDRGRARAFVPRLMDTIGQMGLEEHVRLPGFVSDDALACLYTGALAMVSPSPVEGFGLPAVEAIACGAPTVLSDIPAHRETVGTAGLLFDAHSAEQLAGQLARVLGDGELRADLRTRGRQAVSALSWEGTARAVRGVIDEALG
jgi:glycosyltransferase involved in cell wall biosynthesis